MKSAGSQIMATMSMMKKALHMGTSDTERAARIFLEALRRPKRRTTRRARRMLTGKSSGPRAARETKTTKASKMDQLLQAKSRNQWANMLTSSSTVKTAVKDVLRVSRISLMWVVEPSSLKSRSASNCASMTDVQKFCGPE